MLARLAQGVGELLVLRDGLGELALGLEQSLLEGAHALGCVLQPAAQLLDLLFEDLAVLAELLGFGQGRLQLVLRFVLADGDHLLGRRDGTRGDPTPGFA